MGFSKKFVLSNLFLIGFASLASIDSSPAQAATASRTTAYVIWKGATQPSDYCPAVPYSWSPLDWKYGYWGGANWSDGRNQSSVSSTGSTVDAMDALFRSHDSAYATSANYPTRPVNLRYNYRHAADLALLSGLYRLPNYSHQALGPIFKSSPAGAPTSYVTVVRNGRSVSMPFSEYMRQQAINAFWVVVVL